MNIEYEATFVNVVPNELRKRFKVAGAVLVRPEYLQKRAVFHLPQGNEVRGGWLRVRDEGDRITMSLKVVDGTTISDQKEICLSVDSFDDACSFLENIGCKKKAFQETRRELWRYQNTDVTIDEWPFLEPFVEIEGTSEVSVQTTAEALGFVWEQAKFCHVGTLYSEKYGFPESVFNNETPLLTFEMSNPFVKA